MNKRNYVGYRPTWAEINLKNLSYNFRQIQKSLSAQTKIMVTVKADAYGHGLIPVAKLLESLGVDFLGVASIDEGILLRKAGVRVPIVVLGAMLKEDIDPVFTFRLTPTVCDSALGAALSKRAQAIGESVKVHIKVDTGMGRLGVLCRDALSFIKKIRRLRGVIIEGIFTHFPLADTNEDFTLHQIDLFNHLIARLHKERIFIPLIHAANSLGLLNYVESHFTMVRPGLVIYGLRPDDNLKIHLKPVLSLKTKLVYKKRFPRGHGISYGHEYITKRNTLVAILPIGYGDGYPRNLSNLAPVLIRGKRFKISGRICMDQIMVDVGNNAVRIGDEAVLIGSQGRHTISVEELARLCGTIPYEIVCGLGSRIPRVYIE